MTVFHLTAGEPAADGVRAVAKEQLDRALTAIDDDAVDPHEALHEARKRCKKVRALVRLVRDGAPETYDAVNTELRDTARLVSAERDAAAFVETHDALVREFGEEALAPYAVVRDHLVAHRDGAVLDRIRATLPEVRERLATVRWNVDGWELPSGDAVETLRAGYGRTYGRARARWQEAVDDPTSEAWHEWRKRVKYHRYHVDLLQEAWAGVLAEREEQLHDLTDLLGDDHDAAELRSALVDEAVVDLDQDLLTGYVGLLDVHRTGLQHRALPLAARCCGQPVDEHCAMVFAWWERAIADAREMTVDEDALAPVIPHGR